MKKKDFIELKNKNEADLVKLVKAKQAEANLWYAKVKAGKETNTGRLKVLRREIAQILGIIRGKVEK